MSCAVKPPQFTGDTRGRTASAAARPAWTDWGLRFENGYVFTPGTAGHRDRKKALAAAEEQARQRLASAIQTRIMSELEQDVTIQARLEAGAARSVDERQRISTRLKAVTSGIVQGAEPVDQYVESYESFGQGWEPRYEYWVLVRYPEAEYYRQLQMVRGSSNSRR